MIASAGVLILSGCTGTIYTVKDPVFTNGRTKGVIFYGHKLEEKKTILDRIRNPKTGELTHSMYEKIGTPKYCDPVAVVEKIPVADYTQMYAIAYDAKWFESRKFSVTLDKGMLSAVNSESTPGPKVAAETLQTLASVREDVLDGYVKQSDKSLMNTLDNVTGVAPTTLPIRCSESK